MWPQASCSSGAYKEDPLSGCVCNPRGTKQRLNVRMTDASTPRRPPPPPPPTLLPPYLPPSAAPPYQSRLASPDTRLASREAGASPHPPPPLNNKTPVVATDLVVSAPLGTRLNATVVPANWFQCSNKNGRSKKGSKLIYPPTKHTHSCYENMLFASLGAPRSCFQICRIPCCRAKNICTQKLFLLEHHQNTAKTSYSNTTGTRKGHKDERAHKG